MLSPIISKTQDQVPNPKVLLYEDDVLIIMHRLPNSCAAQIKECLDVFDDFAHFTQLRVNKTKTVIVPKGSEVHDTKDAHLNPATGAQVKGPAK